MTADGLLHISDLFGNDRLVRDGQPLSERAALIAYFEKEIRRPAKFVGIRLGHYSLSQIYALKSSYKDRLQRNGRETADKYWWAITRTSKV